jgi:hypothetical protein
VTVINVIRHPGAVHVLTDGSATKANGDVFGLSKVYLMPQLNAVMAIRGIVGPSVFMAAHFQEAAASYDELKANAVNAAWTFYQTKIAFDDVSQIHEFEIIIAGISESTGPDSYFLCSNGCHGLPPWKIQQLTEASLLPSNDAILRKFQARFPEGVTATDLDPVVDGIAAMEIQRQLAEPDDLAGGLVNRPGSFVQLTTVTPTEISTRIIHRWPEDG